MDKESEDEQLERYIRKIARDETDREKGIDIDIHILNLPRKTKRITIDLDGEQGNEIVGLRSVVLSLNPDDPVDIHKYMVLRDLSDPDIARKTLIEEKHKLICII